jgi:chromosome segregation ATPase
MVSKGEESMIDTSTEAIAAMAPYWAGHPCYELTQALAAERDALKRLNAEYEDHIGSVEAERDHLAADAAKMREALEIIAGQRQCIDNLMGNDDIARAALAGEQAMSDDFASMAEARRVNAQRKQAVNELRAALSAVTADRDRLAAEVAKMRADMQWFLDRVERGEVRSTQTAARFRATLAGDTP